MIGASRRRSCAVFAAALVGAGPLYGQALRPLTVRDAIASTNIISADPLGDQPALFSPGGDRFAVLTERGDLEHDRRVFALLLFKTAEVLARGPADTLVMMSSSTNYPAIADVRWSNDTILTFLGAPG